MPSDSDLPPNDAPGSVPQLMTIRQVAGALAVSPTTVRGWERSGRLLGVRIGSVLRFKAASVRAFITAGEGAPRRAAPLGLLAAGGRPKRRRRAKR
jgi:excisionase family DNA binding protein